MRDSPVATRAAWFITLSVALYVVAGAFSDEKLSFLYKNELHYSASEVSTLGLLVGIPAYLRLFVGAGVDIFTLFGYHRRSYYMLSWLLSAISMAMLALPATYSPPLVIASAFVSAAGGNLFYVIMDAVMVHVGNETGTIGRLQSIQQGVGFVLGLTFIGPLSGYVTQHWPNQLCFGASALCAILGIAITNLIDERRVVVRTNSAEEIASRWRAVAAIRGAVSSPTLWILIGYIFFLIFTPGSATAQFYYSVDVLHLSKQTIGNLRIPSSIGVVAGIVVFGAVSRWIAVWWIIWIAFITDCLACTVGFWLVDVPTAYIVSLVGGFFGSLYNLSLLTIAARACRPPVEAAMYGLMIGVIILAGAVSERLGSAIYDALGPPHHHTLTYAFHAVLWIGLITTLPAVLLIPFLPSWTRSRDPLQRPTEAQAANKP